MAITDYNGSANRARSLKELLEDPITLSKLEAHTYPDVEVMSNGSMFLKTSKFITVTIDKFNREHLRTRFILFDRNLKPVLGFNEPIINFTDKSILGAFLERNASMNSGYGNSGIATLENMFNTSLPEFLYLVPVNEILIESEFMYNTANVSNDPYGMNTFIERAKIKTLNGSYWNKGFVDPEDIIAQENKAWYSEHIGRINDIAGGVNDRSSEISNLLAMM